MRYAGVMDFCANIDIVYDLFDSTLAIYRAFRSHRTAAYYQAWRSSFKVRTALRAAEIMSTS